MSLFEHDWRASWKKALGTISTINYITIIIIIAFV